MHLKTNMFLSIVKHSSSSFYSSLTGQRITGSMLIKALAGVKLVKNHTNAIKSLQVVLFRE